MQNRHHVAEGLQGMEIDLAVPISQSQAKRIKHLRSKKRLALALSLGQSGDHYLMQLRGHGLWEGPHHISLQLSDGFISFAPATGLHAFCQSIRQRYLLQRGSLVSVTLVVVVVVVVLLLLLLSRLPVAIC